MTQEQKLLIDTLCVAITGESRKTSAQVEWPSFLALSMAHGLLPLVCEGLRKMPEAWEQVPQDVQAGLDSAYMQAIFQETQQDYMAQQLKEKLSQAQVPHIFLKGSVLKHDYPVPALRTMSDLDILVYAEDFDKIAEVAESLGAKAVSGDGNHRNYMFPGKVAVEFHPNLLHHATAVGTGINPGWQYAKESSQMTRELSEEGIYLNTICHIAEHFIDGGVGVRFILDIWVSRHLRKTQPDRAFVEAELERFGLLDFSRKLEKLSQVWFSGEESDALTDELGDYILSSGSHGTGKQAMLNALSLSGGGNRASALWKKAFYPKSELEDRFPWCKNKPLLLPAAWLCRAYTAITINGDLIVKWSKDTGKFTKEQVAENREKLGRFGIPKAQKKR